MARHRNVRTMKYEDEFFDDDDVEDCYGQSFDDKYCISPGTAAQFTFPRASNFDLGSYISGDSPAPIPSQMPEIITPKSQAAKVPQKVQQYNDFDEARLNSCLDQVREVIADLHPRDVLVDCINKHNFNCEAVLNELLSSPNAPKPQRQPRQGRRGQEFPSDLFAQSGTISSDDDDEDYDDNYRKDNSKCSLVMAVPHYKQCQEYNSVGEEECSSYSSHNSGDTEDQVSFLSEQNMNSSGNNKIKMSHHLKSGSTSSENVAPSTESSEDNDDDLEVDGGELQSVDDGDQITCFPENNDSNNIACKTEESFELPSGTHNDFESLLKNNSCNDTISNSIKAIPASKFPTQKSDKQELLKLFAMANINKQKMKESAPTNIDDLSSSPKKSLCEEISQSPLQNQNAFSSNSSFTKENSSKSSLADIFQQRRKNSKNNESSSIEEKCEESCVNQGNVKKNSNKLSLSDLAKQRVGSNSQEPVLKVGSSLSQMIISSSPNRNDTPLVQPSSSSSSSSSFTNSNNKPFIDLTNHCFGKGLHYSDQNCEKSLFAGFQSTNSVNKSSKEVSLGKSMLTDKTTLSLTDLMKQRSCSHTSPPNHKNSSLTDLCKSKIVDSSQVIGGRIIEMEPRENSIDARIKQNEHSSASKAEPDNEKKTSSPPQQSNSGDNGGLSVLSNRSKKDCQPMSLGELFNQVNNNSKIDLKQIDGTASKLEDLWQGLPSSKHETEQQLLDKNKGKNLETMEKQFLLPLFLNEASSEYQNLKTIYEASASLFGRVVSYHPKMGKCAEKMPKKNKYDKFSYKTQMCGLTSNKEIKLSRIVPFDFSTPSPDDIVKAHQSKAFAHRH